MKKTPAEILAEAKAKLQAAEARVAREAAKDNPQVGQLNDYLESLNKEINSNSRQLNGPNSFENRVRAAQLRTDWINSQKQLIEAQDNILRNQKEAIQTEINALSERIANGEDVSDYDVNTFFNNLPTDDLSDLIEEEANRKEAWKANTPEAIRKQEQAEKEAQKMMEAGN